MGAVSFLQFGLFLAHRSAHHERVSTKARDTSRTCCDFTVVSAALLPDRIRSRPTAHRTHRQPKCSAAPAHPHCLRRFYHARTVAECKYPFPTFIVSSRLRCVKPKMLSLGFRVIAHLRAGTAHRPAIGNNVTSDPIFNCQVKFKSADSPSVSMIADFFQIINAKWNSKDFLNLNFKMTIFFI